MSKEKYLSIYLSKEEDRLPEALNILAKRSNVTRNQYIKMYLMQLARMAGVLK